LPKSEKPSIDPQTLANYRPVFLLPFLSKILEQVVAEQLVSHIDKEYRSLSPVLFRIQAP